VYFPAKFPARRIESYDAKIFRKKFRRDRKFQPCRSRQHYKRRSLARFHVADAKTFRLDQLSTKSFPGISIVSLLIFC